jgi:hypothetical protein
MIIDPVVVKINRIKPINANDVRLMQKRVVEVLLAVKGKLKHFHLLTDDNSYHYSKKYKAVRSFISNQTEKDTNFGFSLT